jgi:hypothetical protein
MPVKKLEEENDSDKAQLIGISSLLNDYRLCFFLNEFLNADFIQVKPIEIIPKGKTAAVSFRTFKWSSEYSGLELFLFNNQSGNEVLLPEISKMNFVLKITGSYDVKQLLEHLKQIAEISTAVLLPPIKIKSYKNLDHISDNIK